MGAFRDPSQCRFHTCSKLPLDTHCTHENRCHLHRPRLARREMVRRFLSGNPETMKRVKSRQDLASTDTQGHGA